MGCLFLSSYTPLFVLIGMRSLGRSAAVAAISGALIVLGSVGTYLFLSTTEKKVRRGYKLLEVDRRDGDVAAYAATYLLPFVTVFAGTWRDIASLAAFIAFLGIVYVRTRLIYVNPVLALLGYRLARVNAVTADSGRDGERIRWPMFVLADEAVWKGERIWAYGVTDDLLVFDEEMTVGDESEEVEDDDGF